jgi:hypothetical protein
MQQEALPRQLGAQQPVAELRGTVSNINDCMVVSEDKLIIYRLLFLLSSLCPLPVFKQCLSQTSQPSMFQIEIYACLANTPHYWYHTTYTLPSTAESLANAYRQTSHLHTRSREMMYYASCCRGPSGLPTIVE